jgi:hypothetical protein
VLVSAASMAPPPAARPALRPRPPPSPSASTPPPPLAPRPRDPSPPTPGRYKCIETEAEPAYTVREHMRNLKCNINDKTAHLYNAIETALEDHVVCACGARAPG